MGSELEGRVALVTGGGKGIGRAIARALAARGVRVVVTGRDERALGETVGEIANGGGKARHLAGDVRDVAHLAAAVDKSFDAFGGLDVVVANAGQSAKIDLGDVGGLDRARAIFETNLLGAYATFDAAIPRMNGPGRLIATSGDLATRGAAGYAAYGASKAGLLGLVRAAADELAPKKITANAIVPGWVSGASSDQRLAALAASTKRTEDDVKRDVEARLALGRFLEPEDVAEVVVFLCTKAADAITGQALAIG